MNSNPDGGIIKGFFLSMGHKKSISKSHETVPLRPPIAIHTVQIIKEHIAVNQLRRLKLALYI